MVRVKLQWSTRGAGEYLHEPDIVEYIYLMLEIRFPARINLGESIDLEGIVKLMTGELIQLYDTDDSTEAVSYIILPDADYSHKLSWYVYGCSWQADAFGIFQSCLLTAQHHDEPEEDEPDE